MFFFYDFSCRQICSISRRRSPEAQQNEPIRYISKSVRVFPNLKSSFFDPVTLVSVSCLEIAIEKVRPFSPDWLLALSCQVYSQTIE